MSWACGAGLVLLLLIAQRYWMYSPKQSSMTMQWELPFDRETSGCSCNLGSLRERALCNWPCFIFFCVLQKKSFRFGTPWWWVGIIQIHVLCHLSGKNYHNLHLYYDRIRIFWWSITLIFIKMCSVQLSHTFWRWFCYLSISMLLSLTFSLLSLALVCMIYCRDLQRVRQGQGLKCKIEAT